MAAAKLKSYYAEKAKERQVVAGKERHGQLVESLPQADSGKARDQAAAKDTAGLWRKQPRTNQTQPDPLGFCCLVPVATRYKTRYWWLHGGYMETKHGTKKKAR